MADYRSEKMDSLEGEGIARGRWLSFRERVEEGWLDAADEIRQEMAGSGMTPS
jgi:hypothetical protein